MMYGGTGNVKLGKENEDHFLKKHIKKVSFDEERQYIALYGHHKFLLLDYRQTDPNNKVCKVLDEWGTAMKYKYFSRKVEKETLPNHY